MKVIIKSLKKISTMGLFAASLLMATSCSSFMPDRSFIAEMNRESDPFLQPGKDFPVVAGDNGEAYRSRDEIKKRTPASDRERKHTNEQESIKQELEQKEADIPEENVEQYTKDKKYLPTSSDKLYYLSLAPGERANYINSKRLDMQDDLGKHQEFIEKRSVHASELHIGMGKDEVIQLWGKPSRKAIAGNPRNENERWSFMEDGSEKYVYFEKGKVQGWALDL